MIKYISLIATLLASGCAKIDTHPVPPPATGYDIEVLLTPYQQSPPVEKSTATGKFSLNTETGQYAIRIHGFDFDTKTPEPTPLKTHLHCAKPSANGPVVYALSDSWKPSSHNTYTATGMIVDSEVVDSESNSACSFWIRNLKDLQEALNAGELYVNVHSVEHPFGEIRGQIYIVQ